MRIGLVGMGNMGKNHFRILHALSVDVVVCDQNPKVKGLLPAQTKYYQDLDAMLEAEKLDAIDICAPTILHHKFAMRALECNLDVFVEKPIASTLSQAIELREAAEKKGKCLFVGHIERFNPTVIALKKELEGKQILALQFTRVGPMPPQIKDAGVMLDIGIHDVDLASYLSGQKITSVCCARSDNGQYEDAAQILLRLDKGATAIITTNWLTPFKSRKIEAITKEKMYIADLIRGGIEAHFGFKAGNPPSFSTESISASNTEPLLLELTEFLRCISGPLPHKYDVGHAICALGAVEAAKKSATGKIEVKI